MSLVLSTFFAPYAEARMYQWTQPNSGHTYLSGKAPSWYRGQTEGPRVLVFENGQIVDDTATHVSESQRIQLRMLAFAATPKIAQPESQVTLPAPQDLPRSTENQRLKEHDQIAQPKRKAPSPTIPGEALPGIGSLDTGKLPSSGQQPSVLEQVLKTIISKWDQQQEATARRLLNPESNSAPDPLAAPDVLDSQP